MILQQDMTDLNKKYNTLFSYLQGKMDKEMMKVINAERVGNEYPTKGWEVQFNALLYVYTLNYLASNSQTIEYWKEKLKFDQINICYKRTGLDLNTLLTTLDVYN